MGLQVELQVSEVENERVAVPRDSKRILLSTSYVVNVIRIGSMKENE